MTNSTNQNPNQDKTFDIHTKCAGYINRIRQVVPNKGKPYFAATICALRGRPDNDGNYSKTYFDCSIVGTLAIKRVQELIAFQDDQLAIFVTCKIGDIYAESFTFKKGKKQGETGVSIKGRILKIETAKVEGSQYEFIAQPEQQQIPQNNTDNQASHVPQAGSKDENLNADQQWQEQSESDYQNGLPKIVKLDKNDPNFMKVKTRLKEQGYRFDGNEKVWKLPEAA